MKEFTKANVRKWIDKQIDLLDKLRVHSTVDFDDGTKFEDIGMSSFQIHLFDQEAFFKIAEMFGYAVEEEKLFRYDKYTMWYEHLGKRIRIITLKERSEE